MAKSSNNVASEYPEKYERLREELGRTEWIALGSLIERGEPGQGGPRYQWSRRAGGKTVTVALSAEQFEWMKVAVANQRRVWDLLQEMQQATMEYMLAGLSLLGTLKVTNPSKRGVLRSKVCTTLGLSTGRLVGS